MTRYSITESKIRRFTSEGRCQGFGLNYKPWLRVHDVPSRGRSARAKSMTVGRVHHLLSDIEHRVFLNEDWSPSVTDIREQFPLDRDTTRAIARALGVQHPRDPRTLVDVVMTTDLLIDHKGPSGRSHRAIFVKPAKELDCPRTLEKLEIERRYWAAAGVSLQVRTELECSFTRSENIAWAVEMYWLCDEPGPIGQYWRTRSRQFLATRATMRTGTFAVLAAHLEEHVGFKLGEAITVLRHLVARQVVAMDLSSPFDIRQDLSAFELLPPHHAGDTGV